MVERGNPWDIPEWHSVRQEAMLVRHLVGSGATSLGRANYADQMGEYYTAFFGLSVGLERLSKLIMVVDYAISHSGAMPPETVVRDFGHKIEALLDHADKIASKHSLELRFPRPDAPISAKIIECLEAFADARRGRYANFAALGNPNLSQNEPVRKWWDVVADSILQEHYFGKPIQKRIEDNADTVNQMLGSTSYVLFINENRSVMDDLRTSSIRTGQAGIVQKYGRFYALMVVRWLADIYSKLSRIGCYTSNIKAFSGSWEFFDSYRVDDSFLRSRKIWPLR